MIRAAGGILVRDGRVLLVHRPKYDDWSLPKGKLEPGESWEQGALREVEEETGLRCELGGVAGRATYEARGKPKEVRFFHMTAAGEAHAATEVDAVRWVPLDDAEAMLSYDDERELVKRLLQRPSDDRTPSS